ncbi:unnamed protein product [Prunus armeniaca]
MGFKKTTAMNQAMLAKIGWRLHSKDKGLWTKIYEKSLSKAALVLGEVFSMGLPSYPKDKWVTDAPLAQQERVLQKILNVHVGFIGSIPASHIWRPSPNGVFSVKTAYWLFFEGPWWPDYDWKFLWSLRIPPKLQFFLCLTVQGKLLTNEQRVKRNLAGDSACTINFKPWLKANLMSKVKWQADIPRYLVFVAACWHLWKWRNKSNFQPEDEMHVNPRHDILVAAHEWFMTTQILQKTRGVIRDSFRDWTYGFAANLGKGHILEAEMWGLFFGLRLAADRGIRNLLVEMDSAMAVKLVRNATTLDLHHMASLVSGCWELMGKFDACALHHIYRERNLVADHIA